LKQTDKRSGAILQQDRPETKHTQYDIRHIEVKRFSVEDNLSQTNFEQNPIPGENRKKSSAVMFLRSLLLIINKTYHILINLINYQRLKNAKNINTLKLNSYSFEAENKGGFLYG